MGPPFLFANIAALMPWTTVPDHPDCDADQIAVVKEDEDGNPIMDELEGCHDTEGEAEDQITALNISENEEAHMPQDLETTAQTIDDLLAKAENSGDGATGPIDRIDSALSKLDEGAVEEEKAHQDAMEVGQLVTWQNGEARMMGRVKLIVAAGTVQASMGGMELEGQPEDPAIVVEVLDDDGEMTGETTVHRAEQLTIMDRPPGQMSLDSVQFKRLVSAVADEIEEREQAAKNRQKKSRVGERGHMQFKAKVHVERKDVEAGEFVFTGMGSVYGNKDQGGDIAQPGMMTKTIKDNDGKFPLIADHDFSLKSRLGIAHAEETGNGVKTRNFVNLGTQFGQDVASHVEHAEKHGVPLGMSFGYQVVRDEWSEEKQARLLKEVKVFEFTLTQIPMNDEARVTSIEGARTE